MGKVYNYFLDQSERFIVIEIVILDMAESPAPLLVGFIGAWVGIHFPMVIVSIVCLFVCFRVAQSIKSRAYPYYLTGSEKWTKVESRVVSRWYQLRIKMIVILRRIGLSKISDWIFGSESQRSGS